MCSGCKDQIFTADAQNLLFPTELKGQGAAGRCDVLSNVENMAQLRDGDGILQIRRTDIQVRNRLQLAEKDRQNGTQNQQRDQKLLEDESAVGPGVHSWHGSI